MLNIPGYFIDPDLRKDRTDTIQGIGGGLIVYSREGLAVKPVEYDSVLNQFVSFQVLTRNKQSPLNISLIYKSPNSSNENNEELCKFVENHKNNMLIFGDTNYPNIDWELGVSDRRSADFLKTCEDQFLSQLVDFCTHQKGNILDIVLTDRSADILDIKSIGNLSNSDHSVILCEILLEPEFNSSDQLVFDYKNADMNGLNDFFCSIDWDNLFDGKETDNCWSTFTETVEAGTAQFIPKIPRRTKGKPPWMTRNVIRMCRKKQRYWKAYTSSKTPEHFERYKQQEKTTKKAVSSAKRRYEKRIANNGNKKPFNAYIKTKTKDRTPVGPLKVNNATISDNKEITKVLNEYFCSVFTRENIDNFPTVDDLPFLYSLQRTVFTQKKVYDKLSKLKPSSAPGPDGLTARILKDFAGILASPLAAIFNSSMDSGVIPSDWKCANVSPIFKKGSKAKPENYRPVSLTSIPCKVAESIIKDDVVDHLMTYHLIKSSQHGFMSKKSCTTNMLEFLETLTAELDEGHPLDIIYLDFAKAFDKVPIRRLLAKVKAHGVDGKVLQWITNWLSGRKQRVVINGQHSDWEDVLSGVPQGSVLGPLLFIIFINDLDQAAELITTLLKFADDTKAAQKILSDDDRILLQDCINKLFTWASDWGMAFNIEKCKVMHLGRLNPKYQYQMNGIVLKEVDQEKDIGIIVHSSMKPSKQCSEAARRANGVLGQISRSFHFRDRHVFLNLYKQFVRVHLEFAAPCWSPWETSDREVLEKVQRRAINMISGLSGRTYEEKIQELDIMTLEERRIRYDMVETFKMLKGFSNVDSSVWFRTINPNARHTRNNAGYLNLARNESKTNVRKNFFSSRVPPVWNSLPDELKKARNVEAFKNKYDDWIKSQRRPV